MVLGFNHNVMYKGEVFHIQTEDSGVANPHIITLLYREGVILSSKKTSYADILKMESLDQVVEELMKEQHKDMMRRLKSGEFDERAFFASSVPKLAPPEEIEAPARRDPSAQGVAGLFSASPPASSSPSASSDISLLFEIPGKTADAPVTPSRDDGKSGITLDDAVRIFFNASEIS